MSVSENEMDRELLARIAEKYFARNKRKKSDSLDFNADAVPEKEDTADPKQSGRQPTTEDCGPIVKNRGHWRLLFSPLILL